jgi:5-methyltetrahydrofolate--homocysteine methyltransferase
VTEYSLSAADFGSQVAEMIKLGARAVGGCCGTTPEYISSLVGASRGISPKPIEAKDIQMVSSYTHAVEFRGRPIIIGERINPTGKPKFRDAIKQGDIDYILREGIAEEEAGADVLDVNLGIPGIDEGEMLVGVIKSLQSVCDLPLQIDSSDPVAIEKALRVYNGKAMINSVNGKAESLSAILPLVKKYGGVLVALTLDENGIPENAEGRFEIAKRIYDEALKYGVDSKNLIFDPLAMSVSADKNAARETLMAVKLIDECLNCSTILGVSNVSFGLPGRDQLNASFFTMALENGLTAAIVNPHSEEIRRAYSSYLALSGLDENFVDYISYSTEQREKKTEAVTDLKHAIIKGMKTCATGLAAELLKTREALSIINEEIIPALNVVGEGFEKKTIYLPSLLMSAEAAGAAFEVIKSTVKKEEKQNQPIVILATVKGDIHDIGKNIVKLLLENYGFRVVDLGKDVSPEAIAEEAKRLNADLVGLSALMTTTLPAMEESVRLVRAFSPNTKIMVGGAVLTPDYAEKIGADFYGADAMGAVRFAKTVIK